MLAIPDDFTPKSWAQQDRQIVHIRLLQYQVRIQLLLGIVASCAPERLSTKQLIMNVLRKVFVRLLLATSPISHDLMISSLFVLEAYTQSHPCLSHQGREHGQEYDDSVVGMQTAASFCWTFLQLPIGKGEVLPFFISYAPLSALFCYV